MTGKERIMKALRGEQPDRVPMTLRMWKFLRKHYAHVEDPLERDLLAHEEFGVDVWYYSPSPPLPCFYPTSGLWRGIDIWQDPDEAGGAAWRDDIEVEVEYRTRGNKGYWERTIHTPEGDLHDVKCALLITEGSGSGPEVVEPLVKDIKRDIPLLRYMQADPSGYDIREVLEAERRIGDRGITFAHMYGPLDCRGDAMSPQDLLMLYYDDREAFREIVHIGAEAMMAETEVALEAGLGVVKTWWFQASASAGWGPEVYEEVFLPHLVRHVELVHRYGAIYVYYDDGKMRRFTDHYVDAGIDCLMTCCPPPMGDHTAEELKSRYGDRVCLMGGIDVIHEVCLSTPQRIRDLVRARLDVFRPGGGYVLDVSNSVPWETPVENVRALADAGREFGSY